VHQPLTRPRVAVAIGAACAMLVAGCSAEEPVVTPLAEVTADAETITPAPEPDTDDDADALKEEHLYIAEQRVLDFFEVSAEVGADAHQDWDVAFVPYLDLDLLNEFFDLWSTYEQDGVYTEGAAKVTSLTPTDYTPSESGREKVTLDACVDYGPIETFEADGTLIERPAGTATRYRVELVVGHEPANDVWRIEQLEPRVDTPC
jgi:hypothetical protein